MFTDPNSFMKSPFQIAEYSFQSLVLELPSLSA